MSKEKECKNKDCNGCVECNKLIEMSICDECEFNIYKYEDGSIHVGGGYESDYEDEDEYNDAQEKHSKCELCKKRLNESKK
jgi:hypothetical protein